MADIVPRYTLQVVVKSGEECMDTGFHFSVPTTQPAPMPGDEERGQERGQASKLTRYAQCVC